MNVENENIEPVTDLGLALGHSSRCVERRLNSDSGEGANAGSRVDMKSVANDPLSELVWSPQNGLSLKFADSSSVNENPALLLGAEPRIVVLSPSQNVSASGTSSNEKPINEQNFMKSEDASHLRNETAGRNTSGWTPGIDATVMPDSGSGHGDRTGTGSNVEETNFVVRVADQINEKDDFRIWKGDCISGPSNTSVAEKSEAKDTIASSFPADLGPDLALSKPLSGPLPGDPSGGGKEVCSRNQTSSMEIDLASEIHRTGECEANETLVQNLTFAGKMPEESASFLEKESKDKITMTNSPSVHSLEKLEATSENGLQNFASKNICGAAIEILASESAREVKNSPHLEGMLPIDMAISGEHSPTTSRILRYQRKGKEKALSDGDVNKRMSKEDDDSHESVESCNSTGLFSTGKRRWSFEQQLIEGSKNIKQKIHEIPGSTSYVKQDSSFMNWISNMMKGFSKSNLDESPSLDLTLGHPNYGHESSDRKLMSYKRKQDSGCQNVGFLSIFQSLYCLKTKEQERTSNDDFQTELEVVDGLCDINATPLAFHAENDSLYKQFLLPNEKFNEVTSGDGAITAMQLKISSTNFGSSQENSNANSVENKNSCNATLEVAQVDGRTDSNSAIGKYKRSSTENVDSELPLKLQKTHNFAHGSHPLRNLWITRFAPKNSFALSNLDNQNQCKGGTLDCSTSSRRFITCSKNHNSSSNVLSIVETRPNPPEKPPVAVEKELQNYAAEAETSSRFNRTKGHDEQKSICKPNPIISSPIFENSEAMASGFARRLDALRRIMPSDDTDNAAATITCFFCGRKGHHLRHCSKITDGELEDLLGNMNMYNGIQELPWLCIRCFQPNHWAVSCHNSSSRGQGQSEGNDFSPNEMQLNKGIDESKPLLYGNYSIFQAAGAHDPHGPQKEADLKFNQKINEVSTSDRMICNANLIKGCIVSGSGEKKWNENQTMPLCNFVDRHISEVPKKVFDFIKGIRLSRTDILKWMNSHTSLAHLNGFFLRLRLGKWEEGLGGTGYYVSCITGAQRETGSPYTSKYSISVNVGGIKCLVKSQYISNNDFLEDELMAWWSATAKSGVKIPSEEDLRTKIKERKMLGL